MRVVLCEKPSQAADIAKVIGAGKRANGFFQGESLVVTYCIGHLLENAGPEDYDPALAKWSLADLPIIPSEWRMKVKTKTKAQLAVVKMLLAKASDLVIATDPDREGELIAWEVIEHCSYKGPTLRMHLSALNAAAVRKAWAELKPASESISKYHAALARGRGDWLVGMNLSRLFTLLGAQAGYHGVLSIGRVQTPTLRIVVDRDRAIANFKPIPYWSVLLVLQTDARSISAKWVPPPSASDDQGRCICRESALMAVTTAKTATDAVVSEVSKEQNQEKAPLPFSLGDLQQACSSKLGLDVQETLDIAQSLYETHKATTYPRADNGYLDESMFEEVPQIFAALALTDPSIEPVLSTLDPAIKSRAWNSSKVTAHHGIIPTAEPACIDRMTEKEAAVYRLIRSHFLAQFAGDFVFIKLTALISVGNLVFRATGREVLSTGWRSLVENASEGDGYDEPDSRQELTALSNNQALPIERAELKEQKTEAPRPLTQGDLIGAMKGAAKLVSDPRLKQKLRETTGIGTEATRAGIISNLIARGFLVKKRQTLRASEAAFSLIDAAPTAVSDPGMTAVWEQALSMVEEGAMSLESFVDKQSAWVKGMILKYSSTKIAFAAEPSPACPLCKRSMRKRKGTDSWFWGCVAYPDCKGSAPFEDGKPARMKRGKGARSTA